MPVATHDFDYVKAERAINSAGLQRLNEAIAKAIAEERERCAQVAEHLNGWGSKPCPALANHIAKVIRETA